MSNFKVGDIVVCVNNHMRYEELQLRKQYTVSMVQSDALGQTCRVLGSDIWFIAERFELIQQPVSAQQKLDQLKKYFESGNDVPVQQATIKAKDFWAIYNS